MEAAGEAPGPGRLIAHQAERGRPKRAEQDARPERGKQIAHALPWLNRFTATHPLMLSVRRHCISMDNTELKKEADLLVLQCRLAEMLAVYPSWFIGGSYSYDLMCWRDLDIYVLDPAHDLKQCFEVGYELTLRLAANKSFFTNNVGGKPSGLYWGIRLGDARRGAWKLDVWLLDQTGYQQHATYSSVMREKLTSENRRIILTIKEAYWQQASYRDTITSDMIYRAVLDNEVRTVSDFERFVKESAA